MVNVNLPKSKGARILPGQTQTKACYGTDFQIVQHDHGTDRRITEREEKRVLSFGRIGRTVHQDQVRSL